MKEQFLIAIDCGKANSKALAKYKGNTYTTTFPTRMQQVKRFGVEIQPNSYLVEFNGDEFLLGEMVSESYSDFNLKKNSLIHKIAIYTAITSLLQKANAPSTVDIRLAVNVPITTYKDSIQKRNFKSMIENENRTIHLIVNEKAFSFDLSDVTIAFEGMGEVYAKPEKYRKGYTTVIDVGGLNCTYCQFKGVQPMVNTMISSDLGINILKGKIGKAINERYGLSVSSDDLEHVLRCGYFASKGEIFEDSKVIIEELKYDHLQQIVQFAKSRGYTFNMSDIHFVGGGSITLRRYIKQLFSHAVIIDNPLYSNCLSFLKILEVKYA
ncbi:ParM/StbA family protein [Bacillus sp. CRN 9]|nr:ParM/StbA family protein [Bacillus sp. CRN 9]